MRLAVKVPKQRAEEARRHVIKLSLYDYSRRVVRDGNYVLIPVLGKPGPEYEVVEADLPPATMKKLPELRSSYDILGSVAVINDLNMSLERAAVVAGEIMARHSAVKTVLLKRGEVSGDERVARYVVVAGEPVTETLYRESGCLFRLDPTKVFFSPRLAGERLRVASQIDREEKVLDMFAGVGPFSIVIARKHPSATVYAVEKNPEAYRYLCINVELNKLVGRVTPIHGDAAKVVPSLQTKFNRVVMNLPHLSLRYLPTAVAALETNGKIHLYTLEERDDGKVVGETLATMGCLEIVFNRVVKEHSPKSVIRVYDLVKTN
jgi:tRNA (guanine37-N1)-methyltransferase